MSLYPPDPGAESLTAGSVIADNALVRGDGGVRGVQTSGVTLNDSDEMSGLIKVTVNGIELFFKAAHTGATGIINGGGIITINGGDAAKVDITAGSGFIVDIFTDPDNPIITPVSWAAFTAQTVTFLLTDDVSWFLINNVGSLIQTNTEPTREDHRDFIILGRSLHPGPVVVSVADETHAIDTYLAEDLAFALGNINISGNNFNPAATDLTIRRELGVSFLPSANRAVNSKNPHFKTSLVNLGVTFIYIHDDGSGGVTPILGQTDIDPDFFDDGSGVLAAVPNNRWTNHVCSYVASSDVHLVRYGDTVFTSEAAAVAASEKVPVALGPNTNSDLMRTVITVKKGETDLSSSDTTFTNTGRFGLGAGGGSTAGSNDPNAIHVNVAGEISGITEKTSPIGADLIVGEDSADSNNKIRIQLSNLKSALGLVQNNITQEINVQTGTTYTLVDADHGKLVTLDNAAAIALSVNTGLRSDFACAILQKGAGVVTVGGTATINELDSAFDTVGQWALVSISHLGSDVFFIQGRLV